MSKPLSVARKEFKQSILNIINNSELPACVVDEILLNIGNEVYNVAEKEYQHDLQYWETELRKQSEEEIEEVVENEE